MSYISYPPLGGGGGTSGPATVTFPLISPAPGAAGSEPFQLSGGGGLHGTSGGAVVLSVPQFGDALSISTQGAIAAAGALSVQGLATLAGGVSTQALTAASATVTGGASVGGSLGVGGTLQVTGDLSAARVTASGALSAASLTTAGALSAASAQVTGTLTAGSLAVQGTFQAGQIASQGALLFPTSSPNQPGLGLADQPATGVFAAAGSLGLAVAGQAALSFGQSLAATFAGALTAGAATLQSLTTGALTASATATLQAVQAVSLATSANASIAGNLTVQGTSSLANLNIEQLSTDHDLAVGGNTSLAGNLTVAGATSLQSTLAVGGAATFSGGTSLGATQLATALQPLTDSSYTPVRQVATSGQTLKYTFDLEANGNLGLSGALTVLGAAQVASLAASGALSAASASLAGGLAAAGDVASQAALRGVRAVLGGSTVQPYAGNPNGQLAGSLGDLALDTTDGLLYVKAGGAAASNTGWAATTTSATSTSFPLLAPTTQVGAPSYAFADDPMTGVGRTSQMPLLLAVAGAAALQFSAAGAAEFAQAVALDKTLAVTGATALAGLTAASASLGATSTAALTATGLTVNGAGQVTGNLAVGGSLNAGAAQLASLAVSGPATFAATAAAQGALTSATSVAAPRLLAGQAALTSGTGQPAGVVSGSPADAYFQTDAGALWLKMSGQATTGGWTQVSTAATGTTFPLAAPAGSAASPSYGFSQPAGVGVTAGGTNILWGVTNGAVGWALDASSNLKVTGGLTAASLTTTGASSLAGVTAGAISAASAALTGALSVGGATTLAALTAAAAQVASLTTTTGGVTSAAGVSAAGSLAAGTYVQSGSSLWSSLASAPSSGGSQGDIASVTGGANPLYVKAPSGWTALALVGQPAPTSFPLRGPADSATAPNYASAQNPNAGMFTPGAGQLGFSTMGVQAALVGGDQSWTFAAAVTGGAATFASATVNGAFSASGNATLGGTLQLTGAATLASGLSAASLTASGALTAASASISGALSAASATTSGNVTIGGTLTVNGATTYAGVQKSGYLQTGDGTISSPAVAFTSETDLGLYKAANQTLGFAANGASLLSLAPATATFPAAVNVGGNNAGLTSTASNTLQLQTAGTTAVALDAAQNVTLAAKLAVTGLAILGGGATAPTGAWTTSSTSPLRLFTETTAPTTAATGQLFVKSADHNLYFLSSAGVTTQLSPFSVQFPIVGPAGTAAAPTFQAGAGSGLYGFINAGSVTSTGFAVAGLAAASLTVQTVSSKTVYGLFLGDSSNSSNLFGGIFASALVPAGNYGGYGGQLYQVLGGGPGASLYVNEATSGSSNSAWAKVLTTGSFPIVAPAGTAAAPSWSVGATGDGVFLAAGPSQGGGTSTSLAYGGKSVANFFQGAIGSTGTTYYAMGLGDSTQTAVMGGVLCGAQPPGGNISGLGGQIYQYTGGGAASSLYVNEATSGTSSSAWAKVLTTSSTVAPTFPIAATSVGSAANPTYGFGGVSGYSGTGVFATLDATTNNPCVAFASNSIAMGFFEAQTVSSQTIYDFFFGPGSGAIGGIRCGNLNPNGTLGGVGGQLFLYSNGGAGTTLWIHEIATSSTTWSYALTSGMTQIAAQSGTAAAPYYSFFGATNCGMFQSGGVPYIAQGGSPVCNFSSAFAGVAGYNGIQFGVNNTQGQPYIFGGALDCRQRRQSKHQRCQCAYQCALLLNGAGAAGNQIWLHEPS